MTAYRTLPAFVVLIALVAGSALAQASAGNPASSNVAATASHGEAGKGARLDFEDQSVSTVVETILGETLKRSYHIAPGVSGTITFATTQPVSRARMLPILSTLLAWTGNALIEKHGEYLILPAKDAAAGNLVPGLGAHAPGPGMQARMFPLHYVSAAGMQKLLKPFAQAHAFLLVDSQRNLLVMGGTAESLNGYQRTIKMFDTPWLRRMSVGMVELQHIKAADLMPQLDKMFGAHGNTPIAGMLRFIPVKRSNTIIVVSPQPEYLTEVKNWIERIDHGAGDELQVHIYDVKNAQANQLASDLNHLYSGSAAGTGGANARIGAAAAGDSGVSITAAPSQNRLLVHCRPSQWAQIKEAIERLDVAPLQVQIEARILEVQLTGQFSLGVQWYLEQWADGKVGTVAKQQAALGFGGIVYSPATDAFFYSFYAPILQAAIHAIATSSNTTALSAQSVVVKNNQLAKIQVGTRLPVHQSYILGGINPAAGAGAAVAISYVDTGLTLEVRPRVSSGGLIYLTLDQTESFPGIPDQLGNFPINNRQVATQVAVHSGQTILLAHLVQKAKNAAESGVPGLTRIPLLGRLFGITNDQRNRSELVMLITPRIISNNATASSRDARGALNDYLRQFESLAPLQRGKGKP